MTINLDLQCAGYAEKIARGLDEKTIGKALGILQEDGIYAYLLYLFSQKHTDVVNDSLEVIDLVPGFDWDRQPTEANKLHLTLAKLAESIDSLFLAKELLERTLVYARYHIKAAGAVEGRPG